MILGQTYDEQLFKSDMFRLFINTFADSKNGIINHYKESCGLSNTQSTITVSDGAFLLQGGLIQIQGNETISVDLDNNCCILAFEVDLTKENTETEFNQGTFKIIKGTNSTYPTLQQDDIANNSTGIYQMEFARFVASSEGISSFVDKRTFIDFPTMFENIQTQTSNLIESINEKATKLYDDFEQAIANAGKYPVQEVTYSGQSGDATATTTLRRQFNIVTLHIAINMPKSTNVVLSSTLLGVYKVPSEYKPKERITFENSFKNNAGTVEYSYYCSLSKDGEFGTGNLRNNNSSYSHDFTIDVTYMVD